MTAKIIHSLIKILFSSKKGIGMDAGCNGDCGVVTIKKKGKVAMLEKEVHDNHEKLDLEGKL